MSTWVLLRGLTRETRHWGDFPETLARAMPEARVIPLELPGNGDLNHLDSPTSIPGMAAYCRVALTHLGATPPYRLLAMSMGAMVAAAWADGHPEEVEACVLINTSFAAFSPLHHRLRIRAWAAFLRILVTTTEAGREQRIFDLTTRLASARPAVVDAWVELRRAHPVSARNALRQLFAAARFRAPRFASVPTLLLAGKGDRLVDPGCSLEIARRWRCDLAVHPAAGHDLALDDAPWVVAKVQAWLPEALPRQSSAGFLVKP